MTEKACVISGLGDTDLAGDKADDSFLLYPNPVQDFILLDLSLSETVLEDEVAQFSIFDQTGKLQMTAPLPYTSPNSTIPVPIAVDGLAPGLYHLRIETNHGKHSQSFVKLD